MMVGDDFEADVLGASLCGIRAFWFNERSDEVREGELYRTIHDLRALPQALETPWAKTDVQRSFAPTRKYGEQDVSQTTLLVGRKRRL